MASSGSTPAPYILLAAQRAHLVAADGLGAPYAGRSVAVQGDTALVGAPGQTVGSTVGQGCVHVFVRAGTTWTQLATLTASDGFSSDHFGSSVALDGDTALIGAPGAGIDRGAVYVFTRSGEVWSQQAELSASDGAFEDGLGQSVALSGDTAVVGAPEDTTDAGGEAQGSAYVFTGSDAVWSQQAKLTAADGVDVAHFGTSVAVSGDAAVVGDPGDMVGANGAQGSAYVFARGAGVWSQQAKLIAAGGHDGDEFGSSVAASADTVVVGAPSNIGVASGTRGATYVFERTDALWSQQARLTATAGDHGSWFGRAVALSGDEMTVGAATEVGTHEGQGSAYVFLRNGATWSRQLRLVAADGEALDDFGDSVALSDGTTVVGADVDTVGTNSRYGSAYVFTLTSVPVPSIAKISPAKARVGGTVTLTGKAFGAKRGAAKVLFGTKAVTKYVFWSATKVKVRVPKITKGRKAVRVVIGVGKSNVKYFVRL